MCVGALIKFTCGHSDGPYLSKCEKAENMNSICPSLEHIPETKKANFICYDCRAEAVRASTPSSIDSTAVCFQLQVLKLGFELLAD